MRFYKIQICLVTTILFGCSQETKTNPFILSKAQISDMEYRAAASDIEAIKRLRSHYLFKNDDTKAELYFQKALELKHPGAMYEQAMRFAADAKAQSSKAEKFRLLEAARGITIEANRREGIEDSRTDITYSYIERELRKVGAASE